MQVANSYNAATAGSPGPTVTAAETDAEWMANMIGKAADAAFARRDEAELVRRKEATEKMRAAWAEALKGLEVSLEEDAAERFSAGGVYQKVRGLPPSDQTILSRDRLTTRPTHSITCGHSAGSSGQSLDNASSRAISSSSWLGARFARAKGISTVTPCAMMRFARRISSLSISRLLTRLVVHPERSASRPGGQGPAGTDEGGNGRG